MATLTAPSVPQEGGAEPAHYPHGPSSAHRWLNCLGSIEAEKDYPDDTTDAADEGTAAHWLLEQCLLTWKAAPEEWELDTLARDLAANSAHPVVLAGDSTGCLKDWPITGEMIEGVQLAIDTVKDDLRKKGTQLWIESRVRLDDTLGLPVPVGGTCDIMVYLPRSKLLRVLDFKYGKGHVVEVIEYEKGQKPVAHLNEQAVLYALGGLYRFEQETKGKREIKWVELGIVQPRAYHKKGPVRLYKTTPAALTYMEADLVERVPNTWPMLAGAPRTAGEKQCNFCKAKKDCDTYTRWRSEESRSEWEADPVQEIEIMGEPKAEDTAVAVAGKNGSSELALPNLPPASSLTLEQLGAARKAVKWLREWTKDVEDEVHTRLRHDLPVPGAKLVQGRGSRPWNDEKAVAEAMAALIEAGDVSKEAVFEPAKLKSVAKVETAIGKKRFKQLLGDYVSHVEGGPVVADEDSDKPAYVKDSGFEAEQKPEEGDSHPLL